VSVDDVIKQIVQATTVVAVPDEDILQAIKSVLDANPKAVADYKSGKETVIMFLFGQAMKTLQGKGDKGKIQELLKKQLSL
jgi:aspartyl-tRNA(Asn)/glutamyl-tRNA(Gln) amidotransferase subunit B